MFRPRIHSSLVISPLLSVSKYLKIRSIRMSSVILKTLWRNSLKVFLFILSISSVWWRYNSNRTWINIKCKYKKARPRSQRVRSVFSWPTPSTSSSPASLSTNSPLMLKLVQKDVGVYFLFKMLNFTSVLIFTVRLSAQDSSWRGSADQYYGAENYNKNK